MLTASSNSIYSQTETGCGVSIFVFCISVWYQLLKMAVLMFSSSVSSESQMFFTDSSLVFTRLTFADFHLY